MANYVNPIGAGLITGRIDMGVDFTGSGPLYAMGNGTITNVYNSGWPGGTFIGLHMDDGKYVYYAENIQPNVKVGQRVKAGQKIGFARGQYPYVEIGWAAAPGTGQTLAAAHNQQSHSGDPGAVPTGFGKDFANVLKGLGVKINPGGTGTPNTGTQQAQLTGAESWNPIVNAIDQFNPFLGQLISGFKGSPSSIGDLAGGIGGLVTDFAAAIKMVSWLFVPQHWLRILAFFAGIVFMAGSLYMFKEAL
jgi:Peptidase family M23